MILAPGYGHGSLSDLLPSVLAGLGVPGETDRIGLGLHDIRKVCVLLVDGLGAHQLAANPESAPFLTSATTHATTFTAGFPTTTATSLSSLGTGLPAGEHGLVGYLMGVPGFDRVLNPLKWKLHGQGPKVDMLTEFVPETVQPQLTAFERAAADGIEVTRVAPSYQQDSGLTRASLRGGRFRVTVSAGDLVAEASDALMSNPLTTGDRTLVYAYHADLDLTGHVRGPRSTSWASELRLVDAMAEGIANRLPRDAALIVTADHGMVQVESTVDVDASPSLRDGVRLVGGEPRARYVFTEPGAAADVLAAWTAGLGGDYLVLAKDDAIGRGWFGPRVSDGARERIGDVVAVALGSGAVVRRGHEPMQSQLLGHHGSLTEAEMSIPLIVVRGR